jgi:cysteine-rich repeat protein
MTCRGASLTEAVNFYLGLPGYDAFHSNLPPQPDAYYHRPLSEYSSGGVDYVPLIDALVYFHRLYTQPLSIYAADIAVGSDNIPRIAYYDYSRASIELYTCSDAYCSGPGRTDIIGASTVGVYNSYPAVILALDASNNPIVSFYYQSRVMRFTCADQYCASNTVTDSTTGIAQPPRYFYYYNRGMPLPAGPRLDVVRNAGIDTTGYDTGIQGAPPDSTNANNTLSISYAYRPNGEMVAIYPITSVLNGEGYFGPINYFGYGPYTSFAAAYPSSNVEGGVGALNIKGLRLKCQGNLCDKTLTPVNTWQAQPSPLDTVSVTVRGAPAPAVPTITTTCLAPGTSARVTSSVSGATRYEVQISTNNAMTGATVANVTGSSLDYTFSGLTPGANYHINARACNATSCSSFSIPVTQYCTPALTPTAELKILPATGGVGNFLPSPHTIRYNQSLQLSWISSYANHCVLTQISPTPNVVLYNGPNTSSTGLPIGPLTQAFYTYRLVCDNGQSGSLYRESAPSFAIVYVRPAVDITVQDPVSGLWSDGPITIDYNTSARLKWEGQNATSCRVDRTPARTAAQGGNPNFVGVNPGVTGTSTRLLSEPSYSYSATCFNGNPTTGSSNSYRDPDPIVINVRPSTASATCSATPQTVEAGNGSENQVVWTAVPSGGGPTHWFSWEPSVGSNCTGSFSNTITCTYNTPGSYTMEMDMFSLLGNDAGNDCGVVVVAAPDPTSLNASCAGVPATSTGVISWGAFPRGVGLYNYSWEVGGSVIGTTNDLRQTYTSTNPVTAQVIVTETATGRTGTASCVGVPVITPPAVCGDSNVDSGLGETCDDGNTTNGDGCSSMCRIESATNSCGNGICEASQGETPFSCRADCKQKDIRER